MKALNYNDVKDWSLAEIDNKVLESRKSLFDLKMQKSTSGLEKPHLIKILKKNIAKLMTAKNSK